MRTDEGKRLLRYLPWHVVLLAMSVCGLGVWNLVSASRNTLPDRWLSQAQMMGGGAVILVLLCVFDYRALLQLAYPAYGSVVAMLGGVLVAGKVVMGAKRWLQLGPIQVQPSELAKLAMIFALARWFHEDKTDPETERLGYPAGRLWQPALLISLPVLLTLNAADAVLVLGGLGFLGLGLPETVPEWGGDLQQALTSVPTGIWWTALFPGVAMFVLVLGLSFLGEGLESWLAGQMERPN